MAASDFAASESPDRVHCSKLWEVVSNLPLFSKIDSLESTFSLYICPVCFGKCWIEVDEITRVLRLPVSLEINGNFPKNYDATRSAGTRF